MVTLDLRHVGRMLIQTLDGKAASFLMTARLGAPVLTGATITLIITKVVTVATLAVGSGITITAADKIAISLPALQEGIYDYEMEITPVSGEVIRLINKISCTNE